ncbi:MAG: hypothetical protein IT209_07665 [Armatimonadetes bacterium]|nr:hypothetical protein [Armatimonadota bacterium]
MGGLTRLASFAGALAVAVCSVASAQNYPTVTLSSYNPVTFEYRYLVTQTSDATYPFGKFVIDTQAQTSWSLSGPFVNLVDQDWFASYYARTASADSVYWLATSDDQEVPDHQAWQGEFVLVAPNTSPVPGSVLTKDGVVGSNHVSQVDVPGPVVPEPASLLALGGAMLGLPFMRPRRRS